MIRSVTFTILFVLISAGTAFASSCYTMSEAEAEQGIRIHSELMVIGLNCQSMPYGNKSGKNLYVQYRDFTTRHTPLFAEYEDRLISYYKRTGNRNPEGALNTLRTAFANKISNDAARMRPDMFCYHYAPRIEKASSMDARTLRQWAGTFFPSHPVSKPVCEQ